MEAEQDTPNWQKRVDKDIVKKLKPKEVKKQEIINGEETKLTEEALIELEEREKWEDSLFCGLMVA